MEGRQEQDNLIDLATYRAERFNGVKVVLAHMGLIQLRELEANCTERIEAAEHERGVVRGYIDGHPDNDGGGAA